MKRMHMWRKVACLAAVGISLTVISVAVASIPGQAAAAQVTDTSWRAIEGDAVGVPGILYTHTGNSRGPGGANEAAARNNIVAAFQSYGLTVTQEPVTYSGQTYYNVVGTKWGELYPDLEYVVGAHYDSVSNPGADDNASGTAAVIEAARIISQYESDYTIRFIAFTREEQGLYGSEAYVAAHSGDDILGMISLDMIAYDTGGTRARIYSHTTAATLKNALGAAIVTYGGGLTWNDSGWNGQSDHASFDAAGIPAILMIEYDVWDNPYYHTANDRVEQSGNINYGFAVKMTRAVVGFLVDNAGVLVNYNGLKFTHPDGLPEYAQPWGGTTIRVDVTGMGTEVPQPDTGVLHYNTGSGWLTAPMSSVSANVYDAHLPAGTCTTQLQYHFSAQSASGGTFTDPRTAPAEVYTTTFASGRTVFWQNTLDTNPGWTVDSQWAFGHPTGGGGAYGHPDPTNGHTGTNVYGYNLSGDYANNLAEKHLTTAAINCAGQSKVKLGFWRWLGVEQPQYDHAYIRISTNGTTWTNVWSNPAEVADAAWTYVEYDISQWADNQAAVRLRWTMGTTDGGWTYCGWNIDDLTLSSLDCSGPPVCPGDCDCNGAVGFSDIDYFVAAIPDAEEAWAALYAERHGGTPPSCSFDNCDANGDGHVNFADIDPFVALIPSTCP